MINAKMEELRETYEELPRKRISSWMYGAVFFASLGGFLFGFHTGAISNAIPLIKQTFDVDHVWQEIIVSCTVAAAAVASPVGGVLCEIFGRKFAMRASSVFFLLGGVAFTLAQDKLFLLITRIINGFATGLACTSVPLYIAECSPAHSRGFLVSTYSVFITGGNFVGNFLCAAFSTYPGVGWRIAFGFASLPPLIQLVALQCLPESPLWYLDHGRYYDARDSLKKLRVDLLEATTEYELLKLANEKDEQNYAEQGKPSFVSLIKSPKYFGMFLIGWSLFIFQQICGINAVLYYGATIIQMAGVQTLGISLWLSAASSGIYCICTIFSIILVERFGRRILTLASVLMVLISLLILASGFHFVNSSLPLVTVREQLPSEGDYCSQFVSCESCVDSPHCGFCYATDATTLNSVNGSCLPWVDGKNEWSSYGRCSAESVVKEKYRWNSDWCPSTHAWIPVVGLLLYLFSFAPGLGIMPWIVNSELYPRWYRTIGLSVATTVNFIFNLIITLPFLTIVDRMGKSGTFYMFAGFTFVALVLFFLFLPETGGNNLLDDTTKCWTLNYKTKQNCHSKTPLPTDGLRYMRIKGHNRQFYDEDDFSE